MKVMKKTVMLGEDEAYLFLPKQHFDFDEVGKRFELLEDAVSEKTQIIGQGLVRRIPVEFEDGRILDLMFVIHGGIHTWKGMWFLEGARLRNGHDIITFEGDQMIDEGGRLRSGLVSSPGDDIPIRGILGDYVYVHENDFYIVSVKNRLGAGC